MIKKGSTYRVDNMLDVDIHVLAIKYIGKDYLKIKVCFPYRRNPNEIIMDEQIHTVTYKNLKRWKELK